MLRESPRSVRPSGSRTPFEVNTFAALSKVKGSVSAHPRSVSAIGSPAGADPVERDRQTPEAEPRGATEAPSGNRSDHACVRKVLEPGPRRSPSSGSSTGWKTKRASGSPMRRSSGGCGRTRPSSRSTCWSPSRMGDYADGRRCRHRLRPAHRGPRGPVVTRVAGRWPSGSCAGWEAAPTPRRFGSRTACRRGSACGRWPRPVRSLDYRQRIEDALISRV